MFQQNRTKRRKELATLFRTALLVTVLGLAMVAIEQPRLGASPNGHRATADVISHQAVAVRGDATSDEHVADALLPASASEYAPAYAPAGRPASVDVATKALESASPTAYFPAQFPPPKGEPEALPPTF
jgi:hypothetical protein